VNLDGLVTAADVTIVTANDGIKTGRGKMSAASVGWRVGWRGQEWEMDGVQLGGRGFAYIASLGVATSELAVPILYNYTAYEDRVVPLPSNPACAGPPAIPPPAPVPPPFVCSKTGCVWNGSISWSWWALVLGGGAKMDCYATAVDSTGCTYAVSGNAVVDRVAMAGVGYFNGSAAISSYSAVCMWPLNNGSEARVDWIGAGGSVFTITPGIARANAGDFRVWSLPVVGLGGLNVYVGGGGLRGTFQEVIHVGPTAPPPPPLPLPTPIVPPAPGGSCPPGTSPTTPPSSALPGGSAFAEF